MLKLPPRRWRTAAPLHCGMLRGCAGLPGSSSRPWLAILRRALLLLRHEAVVSEAQPQDQKDGREGPWEVDEAYEEEGGAVGFRDGLVGKIDDGGVEERAGEGESDGRVPARPLRAALKGVYERKVTRAACGRQQATRGSSGWKPVALTDGDGVKRAE